MNDGGGRSKGGTAAVRSYVDRVHHAVVARGRFTDLHETGWLAHAATLGPLPDDATRSLVRSALSIATLRLALLPPDQYCAWTYNFVEPRLNVFVAGDNGSHDVTGRVFSDHVRTAERSRLFVEMQRPRHRPAQSIVELDGPDPIVAMQTYYEKALQMQARLLDLGADDLVLVEGLPMVDREWLSTLDGGGVERLFAGDLEPIEERTYTFRCGCDVDRITALVGTMFRDRPEELFDGSDEVEVQCPRCGRHWVVTRHQVLGPSA
jgi:hypothetical protein